MGIQVNESLMTKNGYELTSYYMAIGDQTIVIHRMNGDYTLEASFGVWVSKDARDTHKKSVDVRTVVVNTSETPTSNIYEILYNKLKENLTDYTDFI